MNLIKTFEEACAAKNLNPETVIPDFAGFPESERKAMQAHAKLVIIADVLNDGHVFDWTDREWNKWYPWFVMGSSSGSGFAFHVAVNLCSVSYAGSRLCFKTEELAEYAGTHFIDLYRDYFVK